MAEERTHHARLPSPPVRGGVPLDPLGLRRPTLVEQASPTSTISTKITQSCWTNPVAAIHALRPSKIEPRPSPLKVNKTRNTTASPASRTYLRSTRGSVWPEVGRPCATTTETITESVPRMIPALLKDLEPRRITAHQDATPVLSRHAGLAGIHAPPTSWRSPEASCRYVVHSPWEEARLWPFRGHPDAPERTTGVGSARGRQRKTDRRHVPRIAPTVQNGVQAITLVATGTGAVETMTAQLRVLIVDSKQVSMSVFK